LKSISAAILREGLVAGCGLQVAGWLTPRNPPPTTCNRQRNSVSNFGLLSPFVIRISYLSIGPLTPPGSGANLRAFGERAVRCGGRRSLCRRRKNSRCAILATAPGVGRRIVLFGREPVRAAFYFRAAPPDLSWTSHCCGHRGPQGTGEFSTGPRDMVASGRWQTGDQRSPDTRFKNAFSRIRQATLLPGLGNPSARGETAALRCHQRTSGNAGCARP